MLPQWDPTRIVDKIPFNIALCGGRRQGKSTAVADLVYRMRNKFHLTVCFVGSAACNPQLSGLMQRYWDDRFFFPSWNTPLMEKLFEQQEALKKKGIDRKICILVDDVVLTSNAEDQLAHLAMRGRHFNISLFMCAVSYTTLPKRVRRSLDVLLVYSVPMQGDRKVLTWEFSSQVKMAEYVLKNLGDYECLVMETLSKKQQLFLWKADLSTNTCRTSKQPDHASQKTEASPEKPEECQGVPRQTGTDASQDRTVSSEDFEGGTERNPRVSSV